jgi:hypothetical protein
VRRVALPGAEEARWTLEGARDGCTSEPEIAVYYFRRRTSLQRHHKNKKERRNGTAAVKKTKMRAMDKNTNDSLFPVGVRSYDILFSPALYPV